MTAAPPVDDVEPVLPRYGDNSLADLLPSVAARVGVAGCHDSFGLPAADRWVVLLIDGLGDRLLAENADEAPYLASLRTGAPPLTVGVPSTTATSITSLGTGLAPGRHGIVGYTSRIPGTMRLLNALTWDGSVDPVSWQPHPSMFARIAAAGVEASVASRGSFQGSGLTQVSQRGATYIASDTPRDRVYDVSDITEAAAREGRRSVTYTYESQLDHVGHEEGCGSAAWREVLRAVDRDTLALRNALPAGTALVITGDHGMVDVPDDDRLDADDDSVLREGVVLLGGEARFRQLWTSAGATEDVAACWRERCGDRAWVLTREEAECAGWFGDVADSVRPRIGEVLVASRGTFAVLASRAFPVETRMRGFHGSLTPAEMFVPLLVDVVQA